MNPSDEPVGNDGQELLISRAEPYRTPSDVSDTPGTRGLFRSPVAWMVAIGAAIAVGGLLAFTGVGHSTRDFGESRSSIEEYLAEYPGEMSASAEVTAEDYEIRTSAEE